MADLTKGNWTPYPQPPALVSDLDRAVEEARYAYDRVQRDIGFDPGDPRLMADGTYREADRLFAALEAAIQQREAAKWEQRFADLTFELVGTRRLAEARKADLDRMEQRLEALTDALNNLEE